MAREGKKNVDGSEELGQRRVSAQYEDGDPESTLEIERGKRKEKEEEMGGNEELTLQSSSLRERERTSLPSLVLALSSVDPSGMVKPCRSCLEVD